jgi:hypothetical protein
VDGAADMLPRRNYKTGDRIPETGIYRVAHNKHRLPHEVTLLQDEYFPRCSRCGEHVRFRLLQAVPNPDRHARFRVRLYELPVLDDALPEAA